MMWMEKEMHVFVQILYMKHHLKWTKIVSWKFINIAHASIVLGSI